MTTKKLTGADAEFEALRVKVAEAASALQPNHFEWIVTAVRDHFMREIEKSEMLILRHERFKDEPYPHHLDSAFDGYTREKEVEDAERFLPQYRAIVVFLIALGKLVGHTQARDLGARIADWWKTRDQ